MLLVIVVVFKRVYNPLLVLEENNGLGGEL